MKNKGPWPVAWFDEDAGRIELPVGEPVDVPAPSGRKLSRLDHIVEVRGEG